MRLLPRKLSVLSLLGALGACGDGGPTPDSESGALSAQEDASGYEVWLIDQSPSPGKNYGGTLYIWRGSDVSGASASSATPAAVVDLGGQTNDVCWASTGRNPNGAHMVLFNSTHSHAVVSFVFSGHVAIIDAASRQTVACFSTELGAGGARQAHAAFPTVDDQYVVVANQNGKKLERIRTDYAAGVFTQEPTATLDLANCTTPSGAACQAANIRPDNAPICPIPLANGQVVVTLRGGGMFVVDANQTPMKIIAEYDRANIAGNGCGGAVVQNTLFVNSGAGTIPVNPWQYDLYAFPPVFPATNAPNQPAPILVDRDDSERRDAHGTVAARTSNGAAKARYLWMADRGLGLMSIYDAKTYTLVDEFPMEEGQDDIVHLTPDLLASSPMGHRIFASLRGPAPLSGAHASAGTTPGLGVFRVTKNGAAGKLMAVVPISNIDAQGIERGDAHGVAVRPL